MGKFLSIVALLAISVALFVMYIQPTYDHTKIVKSKVDRLSRALDKIASIRKLRESLSSKYAEFSEENLTRLQKLLPDNVNNVRLILDIDSIASQYGMRLKNVSISERPKSKDTTADQMIIGSGSDEVGEYQSRTLQFSVESTYPEFKAFLKDLESSLRILDVVAISMKPGSNSQVRLPNGLQSVVSQSEEPTYSFSVTIKTYWLKSKI